MTTNNRYAVTYLGNGIMRLPRAGIFQTGTRAIVDEAIARIAVAHGLFAVQPLGADPAGLATKGPQPQQPQAAPAQPPQEEKRRTKGHRASAAIRVPARSEASAAIETSAADAHDR